MQSSAKALEFAAQAMRTIEEARRASNMDVHRHKLNCAADDLRLALQNVNWALKEVETL